MEDASTNIESRQGIGIAVRRILSLALVAGHIAAVGFLDLGGLYIAPMTGNTVQLGIAAVRGQWPHVAILAATLGAFFCGGVVASYVRRRLPRPPFELIIMAALVLAAQVARSGLASPTAIELPLLAASMAMQGATISRFGGLPIQTIVVTNNLLKCADAIAGRYLAHHADAQSKSERPSTADVVLPACAWIGYALGGGAGALAVLHFELPLVLPALLLVFTTADLLGSAEFGKLCIRRQKR